jgi:modification methylase
LLWVKKSPEQTKYTFHYHALKAGNEDRQMRSDWYLPVCSGRERETIRGKKAHTTQKPEALLQRILSATTNPGDMILDPFCGTGTTAVVAKRLGRNFVTIDREAAYLEVAEKRLAGTAALTPPAPSVLIGMPKPRIPFVTLVENGTLPIGGTLRLHKSDLYATIHPDGTLSANGYRGSIHKVASLCLGVPSCNGWTHWYYRDVSTGEERLIDHLRPTSIAH